MSFDVQAVQKDLKAAKLDGWLFYDFRGRDPIAHRILQLPPSMRTRRWFYFVPTKGAPRKLVLKSSRNPLRRFRGRRCTTPRRTSCRRTSQSSSGTRRALPCNIPQGTQSPTSRWWMRARSNWCAASGQKYSAPPTWYKNTKRAGPRNNWNRIWRRARRGVELFVRRFKGRLRARGVATPRANLALSDGA